MELRDSVAVITGGASGIGRGTALAFARRGASVVLADVNRARLDTTRVEIEGLGSACLAVPCDVTVDADVEDLAGRAIDAFGKVDLLMNNAGSVVRGALEEIPVAEWAWQFDVNVLSIARGIHAFLPHMLERGRGYVVNTGSVSGLLAPTGEGAPYVASKFAVAGLTEALALYLRPRGIGVSLLCPGSVATNLGETSRTFGMTLERAIAETAVAAAVQGNREMQPEEVGEIVADGVERERFFILVDPFHAPMLERRARDLNAFVEDRLAGVPVA